MEPSAEIVDTVCEYRIHFISVRKLEGVVLEKKILKVVQFCFIEIKKIQNGAKTQILRVHPVRI